MSSAANAASAQESSPSASRGNFLAQIFINRHKTQGIEITDPQAQTKRIYDRYVEAFKRGAYDLIKEEVDGYSQELIPRKYFSGGFDSSQVAVLMETREGIPAVEGENFKGIKIDLAQASPDAAQKELYIGERLSVLPRKLKVGIIALVMASMGIWSGYHLFHSATAEEIKEKQQVEVEQNADLTSARVTEIYNGLGANIPSFEFHRSGNGAATVSAEDMLASMMGKSFSPELSDQVAKTFQQYLDNICPGVRNRGLTAADFFKFAGSIMIIESNMQTRAQNDAKERSNGYGLFQIESNTARFIASLRKFKDFIKNTQPYTLSNGQDLRKLLKEFAEQLPSLTNDDNTWNVPKVKNSVMQYPEVQLALALIFWEDAFVREFSKPEDAFLKQSEHIFKAYHMTLPASIQSRLATLLPGPASYVDDLVSQYPEFSRQEIIYMILGSNQKAGGPRPMDDYVKVMEILKVYKDFRKDPSNESPKALFAEAEKVRESASEALKESSERIAVLLSDKGVTLGKDQKARFAKGSPEVLNSILSKLHAEDKTQFETLYFKDYWKSVVALREDQRYEGDLDAARYVSYIIYDLMAPVSKDHALTHRDTGAKKKSTVRKEKTASFKNKQASAKKTGAMLDKKKAQERKVREAKAKKITAKVNAKARGQVKSKKPGRDHSEKTGGIDLTGQDRTMDILGDAGAFRLDLSSEQITKLDQDIRGFFPLIIDVQPVKDVKLFLGVRP